MGTRKNVLNLTSTERDNFVKAVLMLKNTLANPLDPPSQQISRYDQFVAIHTYVVSINQNNFPSPRDRGHSNPGFLPWHRKFLLEYEKALQDMIPGVTLPYWDWTDSSATALIFSDTFLSPFGTSGGTVTNEVRSGYFANDAPGTGSNLSTPQPSWWLPELASFPGWRINPNLNIAPQSNPPQGTILRRNPSLAINATNFLNDLTNLFQALNYNDGSTVGNGGFWPALEGNLLGAVSVQVSPPLASPYTTTSGLHGAIHTAVGGQMTFPIIAANDPVFFLHHCNVDRIWAMWQTNGHNDPNNPAAFYPSSGWPQGHKLNDPMWPWVAIPADYSPNNVLLNIILQSFPAVDVRPVDMINHRLLGYSYDTEVVIGVALDQTGSMGELIPFPLVGSQNPTKWDAAKRGVEQLLVDCEGIIASNNAYITVGVETFRNLLGTNTFTPIFTAVPPYGIAKLGSPYDSATFVSNLGTLPPDGGTPLAGALVDTENNLVRPPFGSLPANDIRYLAILTDGLETSPPSLSTLAGQPMPVFPDTMIFAMGLGTDVNSQALSDVVQKGMVAPTGVQQVYPGVDQGKIDKFYANTIARAIHYTPTIDPIYELFPGEHVMVAFDATEADSSYMITAQGYDFNEKNWDFCLVRPDGEHCADTMEGMHDHDHHVIELDPFHVTSRIKNGRCTIILNRGGADSSLWVGRWYLMIMYKMDLGMVMYMPHIGRIILPTGSLPVRGPLYSRLNQKPRMIQAVRVIPRKVTDSVLQIDQAPSTDNNDACAVSVNIYSKTTIQSSLEIDIKSLFAGNDYKIILKVSDKLSSTISNLSVMARLVAPRHSIGNTFADLKTIPLEDRKKYLTLKSTYQFNEVQYLADYEQKKPGVFPVRDEEVIFKKVDNGIFHANVGNNVFPGVHSIGVYVEGTILGKDQKPQQFTRILQTDVALGINPDPVHSKPNLSWNSPNKFVVSVTPTDRLGNIVSPSMPAPVITVNGMAVKGKHVNPYTGEHQVEVTLEGKGIKLDPAGKLIVHGEATIETNTCDKLVLKEGQKFDVGISISGRTLVYSIPNIRQKKD